MIKHERRILLIVIIIMALIALIVDAGAGLLVIYAIIKAKHPDEPVQKKVLFKYTLIWVIIGVIFSIGFYLIS